ncbi:hypothetical protein GcM3_127012 [Golovinomyces cichoracearum]|uniref:SWIM-type domain-containing protein n=1 Tax=Golovinomyces cichoracearum TaxID=62708 RepID=A0A420I5T7_9PEZI|nr:hypothetical protein GcM3_127012 [Golovinomyces cichoracearum]
MNVVAKTKKHFKSQDDFDEFYSAWLKVLDSQSLGAYNDNLRDLKPLHTNAVKYVVNTWLVWREKIVKYWVDKAAHFGNTTTSRNESSHAAIKAYLRNKGTGDHKHFFDTMCLFWGDQHQSIKDSIAQAKIKPRTATNIQLFQDVLGFVHSFALLRINTEKGKLPLKLSDPLPQPCLCTIQQCMGLPCFHTIWERQRNPGTLRLTDIDAHWYYDREALGPIAEHVERRILLNPAVVKGKGRPKGALGKKGANQGETGTRRDPSLFEHVADFELPPSTAPPRIEGDGPVAVAAKRGRGRPPKAKITAQASRDSCYHLRGVSTTVLGFQRGAGTILDPYDAGTLRERAYLRSVHIEKLGSATVPVIEEGSIDIDDLEKSQGGETYTNGSEGEGAVCTSRAIQP